MKPDDGTGGLNGTILRSRLARRLICLFVACALLPAGALALLSFHEVTERLHEYSLRRLGQASRSTGAAIYERILLLENDLKGVEWLLRGEHAEAAGDVAGLLRTRFTGIARVAPGEAGHRMLLGELEALPKLRGPELEHIRAGRTLIVARSDPEGARILMARSLGSEIDADLLVGEVHTPYLWGLPSSDGLGPSHVGVDADFCALSQAGRPLFCTRPELASVPEDAQLRMRLHASGSYEWEVEGTPWLGSYWTLFLRSNFHDPGWTLVTAQARASAFGRTEIFLRDYPLIALGALCFSVLLSVGQIRRSLGPLAALRRGTCDIAAQDFDTRVNVDSGDEFQDLADSFNSMAEQLGSQFEQLATMEELEAERDRAEAASRAKVEFLANMSHEIRTPMTAIVGFADLLLDRDQTEDSRESCIRTIERNGRHLLSLVDEILDLSKIEAGAMRLERIPADPTEVVWDVATLMKPRATGKGIGFELDFDGPLPRRISTDPMRLRQILINLVGNAIKFTECGLVRLVARVDQIQGQPPRLRFDVIDTGIGISNAAVEAIFEPFGQADSTMARRFGGTGLGLAIARSLAESLGGGLSVQSAPGAGSTFSVCVDTGPLDDVEWVGSPSEAEPCERSFASPEPAPRLSPARVLLAEDGVDNQRLIRVILRQAGVDVEVADNGRIACEKAMASMHGGAPYDLILMDMQMPEMDGYEATAELRGAGFEAPIIALTAHALTGDRERCLAAGCDDYATKPIDRPKLLDLIALHLTASRAQSAESAAATG